MNITELLAQLAQPRRPRQATYTPYSDNIGELMQRSMDQAQQSAGLARQAGKGGDLDQIAKVQQQVRADMAFNQGMSTPPDMSFMNADNAMRSMQGAQRSRLAQEELDAYANDQSGMAQQQDRSLLQRVMGRSTPGQEWHAPLVPGATTNVNPYGYLGGKLSNTEAGSLLAQYANSPKLQAEGMNIAQYGMEQENKRYADPKPPVGYRWTDQTFSRVEPLVDQSGTPYYQAKENYISPLEQKRLELQQLGMDRQERQFSRQSALDEYRIGKDEQRFKSQEQRENTRLKQQGFSNANVLRDELNTQIKPYRDVQNSYTDLQATLGNPKATASDDMASIFKYMKMLDPTSVVREGEYANVRNAAGVPDQILNLYNKTLEGTQLNPQQRQEILGTAGKLNDNATKSMQQIQQDYTERAKRAGVEPADVIPSPKPGEIRIINGKKMMWVP